jgi:peptidoglycan/LPS O-acetylase OafA/YrhL
MNSIEHSLPYSKELDGLRGVAILLVLLFHFWPETFSFGFAGVDIFFVLSGFLITKIIVTKVQEGKFSYYEFYRNRIRRIFPALILVLITSLSMGWLFLFPDELLMLAKHTAASAFFYQNTVLIGEQGYWDVSALSKPLLHFWSLSVEEQFYLLWPIIIVTFARLNRLGLLLIVSCGLFLVSVATENEIKAFYHFKSRCWELALGGVLVWIEKLRYTPLILERPIMAYGACFFFH